VPPAQLLALPMLRGLIAGLPSPTTAAAACTVLQVHGRIRRYTSPDEHAFFAEELPSLVLPPITYEQVGGWCA
jgi:hypothetical protein